MQSKRSACNDSDRKQTEEHYRECTRVRLCQSRVRYGSYITLPTQLSEQENCFVGTAPWLLYVCSLLVAAHPATSVAYTSLQHPTTVGVSTESPRSSACSAWLPDLMNVKVWRGSGSRCQSDITVATQLSIDRWSHTIMQAHT